MKTLADAKRVVIKIGTSTLTYETGRINIRRFEKLCKTLSDIKNSGREIVLVSSGAVAVGVAKMGLPCRPQDIPSKQAAAAVGQCELMYLYDKLFFGTKPQGGPSAADPGRAGIGKPGCQRPQYL